MKQITAKPHKTASIFGTNLVIDECCVLSELAAETQLDRESMMWRYRGSHLGEMTVYMSCISLCTLFQKRINVQAIRVNMHWTVCEHICACTQLMKTVSLSLLVDISGSLSWFTWAKQESRRMIETADWSIDSPQPSSHLSRASFYLS